MNFYCCYRKINTIEIFKKFKHVRYLRISILLPITACKLCHFDFDSYFILHVRPRYLCIMNYYSWTKKRYVLNSGQTNHTKDFSLHPWVRTNGSLPLQLNRLKYWQYIILIKNICCKINNSNDEIACIYFDTRVIIFEDEYWHRLFVYIGWPVRIHLFHSKLTGHFKLIQIA